MDFKEFVKEVKAGVDSGKGFDYILVGKMPDILTKACVGKSSFYDMLVALEKEELSEFERGTAVMALQAYLKSLNF